MSEIGLLPAYLIVGTDGVKRDHAVSRMKARLEKTGMVEFNLDERDMTKDPDIESIIGSLNTFPMGSEFRLVILDGCSKLAKAISEPLVDYLASPSPTTVCLIIADSLAKNTRLYKAIAKIDKKDLGLALKGANDQVKEFFFSNMSARAGKLLKDDMEAMGPVRLKAVEATQALALIHI